MDHNLSPIDTSPLRANEDWFNENLHLYYDNTCLTIKPAFWPFIKGLPLVMFLGTFVIVSMIVVGLLCAVLSQGPRAVWTRLDVGGLLGILAIFFVMLLVVSCLALLVGLFGVLTFRRLVFDKTKGVIRLRSKVQIDMSRVAGVQVLFGGYKENSEGRCNVYEMNLLLSDGSRSNVIVYTSKDWIRESGIDVAKWIGVPFYDHIDVTTPADHAIIYRGGL